VPQAEQAEIKAIGPREIIVPRAEAIHAGFHHVIAANVIVMRTRPDGRTPLAPYFGLAFVISASPLRLAMREPVGLPSCDRVLPVGKRYRAAREARTPTSRKSTTRHGAP